MRPFLFVYVSGLFVLVVVGYEWGNHINVGVGNHWQPFVAQQKLTNGYNIVYAVLANAVDVVVVPERASDHTAVHILFW